MPIVNPPLSMALPARDPLRMGQFTTAKPGEPEDIWQPQYDRVNYAATGAASVSFFTVALGASATLLPGTGAAAASKIKTYRDTSFQQPGVIPTKEFMVVAFSMLYIPQQQVVGAANTVSIQDDKMRLAYGGYFTFQLIDKPYLIVPLDLLGGIGGIPSTTQNAATITSPVGMNADKPFWLEYPLTIRAYETIVASITFDNSPATTQSFDLRLTMLGFIRRPAQ